MFCFSLDFYQNMTHYPNQEQRQALLAELHTIPGCETYGADQLRRYFENRRSKRQEFKGTVPKSDAENIDDHSVDSQDVGSKRKRKSVKRTPVRPKNIFMVPGGAREILSG